MKDDIEILDVNMDETDRTAVKNKAAKRVQDNKTKENPKRGNHKKENSPRENSGNKKPKKENRALKIIGRYAMDRPRLPETCLFRQSLRQGR